jgi:hypothetical protein
MWRYTWLNNALTISVPQTVDNRELTWHEFGQPICGDGGVGCECR